MDSRLATECAAREPDGDRAWHLYQSRCANADRATRRAFRDATRGVHSSSIEWDAPRDAAPAAVPVLPSQPVADAKRSGCVGVLSDEHIGSDYARTSDMVRWIHEVYAQGVRTFLHVGDTLEGLYDHARWEAVQGWDKQAKLLYDVLPALPGASHWLIGGNHCTTAWSAAGMDPAQHLEDFFKARGRTDLHACGLRDALLDVDGLRFELWHPGGSGEACPLSNKVVRKLNGMPHDRRPDVILVGHWHKWAVWEHAGTYCVLCPTWQGIGGEFGNSLATLPAVGGLVLRWELAAPRRMQRFSVDRWVLHQEQRVIQVPKAA